MASFLRQIVASPRVRHPEANLDLCYAADNIVVTSGPSDSYPKVAYRNPLKSLVAFLDERHKDKWSIWEFRAEGTGYPDSEVYDRIHHYPWPDHHPPPFALMPLIMGSMRKWLKDDAIEGRVAVIHCKAGKGRSGTVTCSYLISEEGWTPEDAMKRFTERRIRPGFGAGISIPSQKRTISYIDRWTKHGKKYIERAAEIVEIHIWGLRDGVKVAVDGFVEQGKVIKTFHTFTDDQREVLRGEVKTTSLTDVAFDVLGRWKEQKQQQQQQQQPAQRPNDTSSSTQSESNGVEKESDTSKTQVTNNDSDPSTGDVIFKPKKPIHIPSSDICIDFERRNRTKLGGISMVTAIAHVWFNIFFEGNGPEQDGKPDDSGVFEIKWDALDGLKGSSRKGPKAFDRVAVLWQASRDENLGEGVEIREPAPHEEAKQVKPADWRLNDDKSEDYEKKLGLRSTKRESRDLQPSGVTNEGQLQQVEELEPLGRQITAGEQNGSSTIQQK